ncbi:MAG: lactate utilization protein B/C [Sphingobacteriia bacterium]|nr:MAG: lactate utilization protein B/C [Sphingobacteriia bacterium]
MSESRQNILKKISEALTKKVAKPFSEPAAGTELFQPSVKELELEFVENFTGLLGKFSFCANETELVQQLQELLAVRKWTNIYCRETEIISNLADLQFTPNYTDNLPECDVAITGCEYLIARTGSMMLSSGSESGRTVSVYAPVHICIAKTSQLIYDIDEALYLVREKYGAELPSVISLATGPSRTADIEKTLVVGVHGPKEVYCFLVDD